MNPPAALSNDQVRKLLNHESISLLHPWCTKDEQAVDDFYRVVCDELTRATGSSSRVEWDHYGSGYASFIEAWFYKAAPGFAVPSSVRHGEEYMGLVLLLSRHSPFFAVMEGAKHWHRNGGSSCLPSFEAVDRLSSQGVIDLAAQVVPLLGGKGLQRLSREQLCAPLPQGTRVPTILQDPPYTQFDALFHWED